MISFRKKRIFIDGCLNILYLAYISGSITASFIKVDL